MHHLHRSRPDDEDPRVTDSISLLCHSASVAEHSSLHRPTDARLPIPHFCPCPQPLGLLQQSRDQPDQPASHPYPASSISPKCHSKAHLQPETLRPHHWVMRSSVSIGSACHSELHSRCRCWRTVHGAALAAPPHSASSFTCVTLSHPEQWSLQ